jgi:hypothetical protein
MLLPLGHQRSHFVGGKRFVAGGYVEREGAAGRSEKEKSVGHTKHYPHWHRLSHGTARGEPFLLDIVGDSEGNNVARTRTGHWLVQRADARRGEEKMAETRSVSQPTARQVSESSTMS